MVSAQAATFSALSGLGGRIPATHLLVGSVTAERGLGEDCTITLRGHVVDVATTVIVPNSGIEKSVSATAEGFQKLEAQVAMAACLALDGDATAVDQKVDVERSDFYAQLAEANRLIYDGRPEEALQITQLLAASVKAEMLTKVAETESAAYQALIEQAVQEGREAESQELAEKARKREQELREQYRDALRQQRITEDQEDAKRRVLRGDGFSYNGDWDEAIAEYTKALALRSENADAYYGRGNAYSDLKQYDLAIADYTKVIELYPRAEYAHIGRGVAYSALKQYDQAIADYTKAIEMAPQDVAPRSNLSFCLYLTGRLDEAIAAGREALALAPDLVNAVGNLALALLASGQDDEAVAQYRRLVEIGAQAALDAGVSNDLDDLLAVHPNLHLAHFCLGLLYEGAGTKAKAAEQYRAYIAGAPEGKWAKEARERLAGVE